MAKKTKKTKYKDERTLLPMTQQSFNQIIDNSVDLVFDCIASDLYNDHDVKAWVDDNNAKMALALLISRAVLAEIEKNSKSS